MADQSTPYAQALARHVKAALLHLRQAQDLAEPAGIDIYASEHDVPAASLIRTAGEAVEDLDTWAIGNARAHGAADAETYAYSECWCHAEHGSLPAGSWLREPEPDAGRDPAARAVLRSALARLRQEREAWEETARACVCPPGLCTRGDFQDHVGESGGCMVCADLDPSRPCCGAVSRRMRADFESYPDGIGDPANIGILSGGRIVDTESEAGQ
jgi:hypothetical protein